MPLIEELPVNQPPRASAGWAYVPDTGPIAAQQPSTRGDRKRLAATAAASRNQSATATAKQQKAIQQRLDSLDKENYRDGISVPVPPRKEKVGRKMTSNVRRILTYQRGFAHYLADEEANNPNGITYQLPTLPPAVPGLAKEQNATARSKRRSTVTKGAMTSEAASSDARDATDTSQTKGRKRGRPSSSHKPNIAESNLMDATDTDAARVKPEESQDAEMSNAPTITQAQQESTPVPAQQQQQQSPQPPSYPPEWDHDPLLASSASEVPRMPSDRVMQLLISEPPLTYNAARATPLEPDKQLPSRKFCGVCGYWGKVKCKKCGEWTCGILECWRGHEGVCPMANAF
ncbi:hypothetical protein H2198_004550 [Neophaeococcomyces mojaviensis]|uniref:Uncharacterized protein n=1 Tax=Neophaeococcomyces mojaviensis TaxID=3383035 RepID=A0ACC3A868_9EURO|nr:hypothetical protein H2198_004550 [Knufia sp. JES_112]